MVAPGFLGSGPVGNMALTVLGPRIGFLIHKAGNVVVFPEWSRDGEQTTATLASRATPSNEAAIYAGPEWPPEVVRGEKKRTENSGRLAGDGGICPPPSPPSLFLTPASSSGLHFGPLLRPSSGMTWD